MSGRYDLVGVGEGMVELWADEPLGEASCLRRAYGGDVLNALVTASRLGSRTSFVTRVGDDPFGPALLRAWQAEGIDTTHATLTSGTNGVYFVSLTADGDREFTYRRAGSAASSLSPAHAGLRAARDARAVLLSGITQAISASAQSATLHAAITARANGALVAYDPNYRPALWSARGGVHAASAAFHELLDFVDVLLPSFPADFALLGDVTRDAPSALAYLARVVRPDVLVGVKAAMDGAYLLKVGEVTHVPTVHVDVVDATGAGDTWNGALLHALLRGAAPEHAAQSAHRHARWTLAHRGAIAPRPHDLSQEHA